MVDSLEALRDALGTMAQLADVEVALGQNDGSDRGLQSVHPTSRRSEHLSPPERAAHGGWSTHAGFRWRHVGAPGLAWVAVEDKPVADAIVAFVDRRVGDAGPPVSSAVWQALLSAIRHEIRAPMTVLRSVTSLLLDEPDMDPPDRDRFLHALDREGRRVINFIEDGLTVAGVAVGEPFERDRLDVAHQVRGVVGVIGPHCRANGITVSLRVPDARQVVLGDRQLIDRMLLVMAGHTLRSAPEGVTLTITVKPSGDAVRVSVQDDGPVDKDVGADLAFRSFRRSTARGKHAPGNGVGLYLVERIAAAHGWHVGAGVDNGLNTLWVDMPTAPPE